MELRTTPCTLPCEVPDWREVCDSVWGSGLEGNLRQFSQYGACTCYMPRHSSIKRTLFRIYMKFIASTHCNMNSYTQYKLFLPLFFISDKPLRGFAPLISLTTFFENSLVCQWQQCTFVCTGVRDLLPGARFPTLSIRTLSLYNILLFLVSDFYNRSTKMLAVSICNQCK